MEGPSIEIEEAMIEARNHSIEIEGRMIEARDGSIEGEGHSIEIEGAFVEEILQSTSIERPSTPITWKAIDTIDASSSTIRSFISTIGSSGAIEEASTS